MKNNKIFALDIGTRSIVGIVGEYAGDVLKIIATERIEHKTRAMLDGQIHDIPEVSKTISQIKNKLSETCGELKNVAVAAAGRALRTITAEAELSFPNIKQFSTTDEQTLELLAIQNAQAELSMQDHNNIEDYYCVGHSIMYNTLDGTRIKSLLAQQGKKASIKIIATFLPRQVVDSLNEAVKEAELNISTMTLEPIAAINILIPPTMRHLNLVLVDIGAGTSDIAITKEHTIVAYGMVPFAGDEITESLSQTFLLDFNDAEQVKQTISDTKKEATTNNVLGQKITLTYEQATEAIANTVAQLAQNIASQIAQLNQNKPQAVLLVGGGALTPLLPQALADALDIPVNNIAVRSIDSADDITAIPKELQTSDSITPLGILKIAKNKAFNFIHVFINKNKVRLFNSGTITLTDALIASGLNLNSLKKRPGLGMTVTLNNKPLTIPNKTEQETVVLLNDKKADLSAPIKDNDQITIKTNDTTPTVHLADIAKIPANLRLQINKKTYELMPEIIINDVPASLNTIINDRDNIFIKQAKTFKEALLTVNYPDLPQETTFEYYINGQPYFFKTSLLLFKNDNPASINDPINDQDHWQISFSETNLPTLEDIKDILDTTLQSKENNLTDSTDEITVYFNEKALKLPTQKITLTINGQVASFKDKLTPNASITYKKEALPEPIISDLLLIAEEDITTKLFSACKTAILLNNKNAEFTTPLKDGDKVVLKIFYKK